MVNQIVAYHVNLEVWFRRDGRDWLAWCRALDVMSQAKTKKAAIESLKEAVAAWFESCIERGVLAQALSEVGFTNVPKGEAVGDANVVRVVTQPRKSQRKPSKSGAISFSVGRNKNTDFIEGTIPAYVAAQQLGDTPRAAA